MFFRFCLHNTVFQQISSTVSVKKITFLLSQSFHEFIQRQTVFRNKLAPVVHGIGDLVDDIAGEICGAGKDFQCEGDIFAGDGHIGSRRFIVGGFDCFEDPFAADDTGGIAFFVEGLVCGTFSIGLLKMDDGGVSTQFFQPAVGIAVGIHGIEPRICSTVGFYDLQQSRIAFTFERAGYDRFFRFRTAEIDAFRSAVGTDGIEGGKESGIIFRSKFALSGLMSRIDRQIEILAVQCIAVFQKLSGICHI